MNEEYSDKDIMFTPRAKLALEIAWKLAKKQMKTKIYSEHLLEAIVSIHNSLAMKVLTRLGTDELEVKQGILNKIQSK